MTNEGTGGMVERVAQAILDVQEADRALSDRSAWPAYVKEARAAIAAMREPTEAMLCDGQENIGFEVEFIGGGGNFKVGTIELGDAYRAMINSALSEQKGE